MATGRLCSTASAATRGNARIPGALSLRRAGVSLRYCARTRVLGHQSVRLQLLPELRRVPGCGYPYPAGPFRDTQCQCHGRCRRVSGGALRILRRRIDGNATRAPRSALDPSSRCLTAAVEYSMPWAQPSTSTLSSTKARNSTRATQPGSGFGWGTMACRVRSVLDRLLRHAVGRIFAFIRNRLVGSYWFFTFTSRAWFCR